MHAGRLTVLRSGSARASLAPSPRPSSPTWASRCGRRRSAQRAHAARSFAGPAARRQADGACLRTRRSASQQRPGRSRAAQGAVAGLCAGRDMGHGAAVFAAAQCLVCAAGRAQRKRRARRGLADGAPALRRLQSARGVFCCHLAVQLVFVSLIAALLAVHQQARTLLPASAAAAAP